jgi:hypothetical protein
MRATHEMSLCAKAMAGVNNGIITPSIQSCLFGCAVRDLCLDGRTCIWDIFRARPYVKSFTSTIY